MVPTRLDLRGEALQTAALPSIAPVASCQARRRSSRSLFPCLPEVCHRFAEGYPERQEIMMPAGVEERLQQEETDG
jgi:hypothetical protein